MCVCVCVYVYVFRCVWKWVVVTLCCSLRATEPRIHAATPQVDTFKERVMLVWYSLLLSQRVLVCGKGVPAGDVGQACLAVPLLAKPLRGFEEHLDPYVALTDLEPIMKPTYICGTTNQLFATREDWWDCLIDLSSGSVRHNKSITVSGDDLSFVKEVLETLPTLHPHECVSA